MKSKWPEGWYSRDSLCYGVGARMANITAKCKKRLSPSLADDQGLAEVPVAAIGDSEEINGALSGQPGSGLVRERLRAGF